MTKNTDTKPIIEEDNIQEEAPYNTVSFVYSSINLNPIVHNALAKYRRIETCHLDYRGETAFMHLQDDWQKLRTIGVFSQYVDREHPQPNIRMTVNLYAYVIGTDRVVDNFLETNPKFKEKLKPTERTEVLVFNYSNYENMETFSDDEFKFIDWVVDSPFKATFQIIPKISCRAQYVVNLSTYKNGSNPVIDHYMEANQDKMTENFYKHSGYYNE